MGLIPHCVRQRFRSQMLSIKTIVMYRCVQVAYRCGQHDHVPCCGVVQSLLHGVIARVIQEMPMLTQQQ